MKKVIILIAAAAMLLSSCAGNTEYVATVGNEKISTAEIKFYLESVKSQMIGTELSSDEDWQTKEIEGRKAIDLAKERALDTAVTNLAYIEVAKKLDIKLSSEDKKKISDNKSQFISQFGTKEFYNEYLKNNDIDDDFIDMLCESMIYSNLLTEKMIEEEPVTDDAVSQYYAENESDIKTTYRKAKHILILTRNMDTGEEFSEQDKETAKQKAEDILKRAKAGENFDTLAKEYSEDPGLETNPDGYVFGDGEMLSEFQDGVDALSEGEFGLVKTDIGYHVLFRLPLGLEDVKNKVASTIVIERLDEKMSEWENETELKIEINDELMAEIL